MQVSVILATYQSPAWLEKVLWGYAVQTFRNFEIVIADDGSDERTAQVLAAARCHLGVPVHHVWHADDGFRKCEILNKAILRAQHDYLVFSDGDCIPRADFLQAHAEHARQGVFLTGSYVRLPLTTSECITRDDVLSGRCFEWTWLVAHGLPSHRKYRKKIRANKRWSPVLNRLAFARTNFKGGNASVWKADVMAVHGFDHRMRWGGLDREFGVRLKQAGLKARHVRYDTCVLHLDHARHYKDMAAVAKNKALREHHRKTGVCRTEHGLTTLPGWREQAACTQPTQGEGA